ncbi:MAG: MFS transporter, partial [Erysipelotrichales bacterium]
MKLTKAERSWVLYDVANSAFILTITATIPIYFRDVLAVGLADHVVSQWMYIATSTSVLVLAVLSPILGAIADYQGMKKKLFI